MYESVQGCSLPGRGKARERGGTGEQRWREGRREGERKRERKKEGKEGETLNKWRRGRETEDGDSARL